MKKGRHRRFEEARKLKQSGPDEFLFRDFVDEDGAESTDGAEGEDEYSDIARKYGAFDEEDADDETA